MKSGSPSLRKIAERAGVSTMTVSRALRGLPKVSDEQRARILEIAEELGYRPDPRISQLMAHLRQGRAVAGTSTLAWLTPHDEERQGASRGYRMGLLEGARRRAEKLGYTLDVISFHKAGVSPERCRHILEARGIQGVIISPLGSRDRRLEVPLDNFSVASIGFALDEPRFHRVGENFFEDTQLALNRLAVRGCSRVGVVLGMDPKQHMVEHVLGAWAGWCVQERLTLPEPLVCTPLREVDVKDWFKSEKPDGIVSNVDLRDWIPKKVKGFRVGFFFEEDELPGVVPDLEAIGSAAVDMVVAQILRTETGVPRERKTMLLSGLLREEA
ncbi:MAG: LacI family DNA-binding transcriptional regulator [Verrucomicrobia bacterium]|nr:LacI family DNA-binding transcriptional regulator [Verrucomicrobiota bacterium]MCH8510270.1 LacI family transcriptional regulator [Kiritimatiellia bacterium]